MVWRCGWYCGFTLWSVLTLVVFGMAMWLVLWFHVMVYINTGCICYGAVVGTVVSRCGLYLHWLHLIWRCGFTRWSMSALAFFFSFLIVLWLDAWTIYLHWLWSGAVVSRVGLCLHWLNFFLNFIYIYIYIALWLDAWSISALVVVWRCGVTRWSTCLYSGFVRHSAMFHAVIFIDTCCIWCGAMICPLVMINITLTVRWLT